MAAQEQQQGYQGYANYPTWAVALEISNAQELQATWLDEARACREEAPDAEAVKHNIWTAAQAEVYTLADRLKAAWEGEAEEAGLDGALADLLTWALGEVDWREVAKELLDTLDEQS